MSETMKADNDGYNVVGIKAPLEWARTQTDEVGEYVHLVYDEDERELRCYLSVESNDPEEVNARIKTVIEDVKFRKNTSDNRDVNIEYFFLTWTEAMDFMNFLELMVLTGGDSGLTVRWDESDGGTMMDDEATSMEALNFTYKTIDGRERLSQIRSEWQHPSHRMANIEGEGF